MAQTTAAPAAPTTPLPGRLGYQPALDGVRALAIALVVLFHYPWDQVFYKANPVHGGFLGVDVFFVLSGFLITTLLLQEHAALGSVSLRRFYARRALRLLPAFFVLFAIALVLHFTLAHGDGNRPKALGLFGMLFYAANWVNVYRDGALGVVAHTWSLAIEEQFYLVWPVILVFLLRRRLRLSTIAVIATVGIVASSLWRVWYWYHHLGHRNFVTYYLAMTNRLPRNAPGTLTHRTNVWNRLYFGSDTRADALLVGCLVAIVLFWLLPRLGARPRAPERGRRSRARRLRGHRVAGRRRDVGLAAGVGHPRARARRRGRHRRARRRAASPLARVLAVGPLAWLGRRSYAIYLFHTVVFEYCNRSHVHIPPPLSFVFQIDGRPRRRGALAPARRGPDAPAQATLRAGGAHAGPDLTT